MDLLVTLSYLSMVLFGHVQVNSFARCTWDMTHCMPDHHSLTSASEGAVFVFSDGEKDVAFTMILGLAEGTLKSCRLRAG